MNDDDALSRTAQGDAPTIVADPGDNRRAQNPTRIMTPQVLAWYMQKRRRKRSEEDWQSDNPPEEQLRAPTGPQMLGP